MAYPRPPRAPAHRARTIRGHIPLTLRPLSAALLLGVVACGGDAGIDPIEVRNLSMVVEPPTMFLGEGQSGRIFARLVDDIGATVASDDLRWASSDPTVATVDETGTVTAVKTGDVLITASAKGKSDGSSVKVRGRGKLEIHLTSGTGQTGPVGELLPQALVVEVRDASGSGVSGVDVDWTVSSGNGSTSAPSTTTNQNGLTQVLWTLGPTAGGQSLDAQIKGAGMVSFSATATAGGPASVTVSPQDATIEVSQKLQFQAAVKDKFGNALPGANLIWASSAGDVAFMDTTGTVIGMSAGSASIEAYSGPAMGSATLYVTDPSSVPGTVNDLGVSSTTSSSITLSFTQVDDGTGSPADYEVRYAVSPMGNRWDSALPASSGSCASPVSGTSIGIHLVCSVAGLGPSTSYDFQVVAVTGDGSKRGNPSNLATGTTAATAPEPATVAASPDALTLNSLGETYQLTATVRDASGAVLSGVGLAWSTSDASIVTVDDMGFVVSKAVGTASIIVATVCCSLSDTVSVTVNESGPLGAVTDLSHIGGGILSWTQVANSTGNPANYALRYGCPTISWGAAYPTEVSISGTSVGAQLEYDTNQSSGSTCQYQLVAYEGALNADAVFGPLSNIATVDLSGGTQTSVASSITVSPVSFSMTLGETRSLTATVRDQNGQVMSGLPIVWTSAAPLVATVVSTGTSTALASGLTEGAFSLEARLASPAAAPSASTVFSGPFEAVLSSAEGELMGVANGTVTTSSSQGAPTPPAPGSPNIAADWREGGKNDIQSANSYAQARSAGGWSEFTNGSPTSFGWTTDFLGDGTRAIVFPWIQNAGNPSGCLGNGVPPNGSQQNLGIFRTVNLNADEIYTSYKMHLGRTVLDSSPDAVGKVDTWDSELDGQYGRKWFIWMRDLSTSYGRVQMFSKSSGGTRSAITPPPGGAAIPGVTTTWDPNGDAGQTVTLTIWIKRAGGTSGEVKFWINGALIVHVTGIDTWPEAEWRQIQIGGPDWICSPVNQTQYLWDLVIWAN